MILLMSIFLFCSLLIVYHHAGYPILIKLISKNRTSKSNRKQSESISDAELPSIGLVIPIYNEENVIADKLRNISFVDYPDEKLTVHLIFDGCTDRSYEVAKKVLEEPLLGRLNVSIHNSHINKGKVAQLNAVLPCITSDITALSDVSALLSIDALTIAARHFQNTEIGAVCATYRFLSDGAVQEKSYWKYQCDIKNSESNLGSTLGAHGAFYVFRSDLFCPLPSDTINDDFVLPCTIIQQNHRVIYEQEMIAVELEATDVEQDLNRRLRIGAGNFQQSIRLLPLLNPKYGMTAFMFFSCKWLRPFMPMLFLLALLSSGVLAAYSLWFVPIVAVQLLVYGVATLQHYFKINNHLLVKIHYVISAHFINALAISHYLSGKYTTPWRRSHD
ncbi:glycosyltransferase family 2 protein [Marinomonas balearica]|uniref:Cellulose synthase/poly-beta-1,6-N-acetylglucosamine synthase-like glycosyltransferase n=1 Tax=Marinomonas balearica TaxID=491947 RepID=A0A4R6MGN3_9GAMM|nr:glycosyltransferase family 2 protein [Marinomonas balearica]TDP01072.1 cellulose synthase/poly-beta-1,6-N-acetylglucosamine synthase-like glycosyltransferase [Marinomonas balearica]